MRDNERCRHPDCVYRNTSIPETSQRYQGRCNYMTMTGKSRIAGLPEKLQLPCNCVSYVPSGKDPKQYQEENWKSKAMALYREGATDKEIAAATGKDYDSVRGWRKSQGLPLHRDKKGPEVTFDWKLAEKLYQQGLYDKQIAEKMGCSVSAVWRWRFKYELFPNGHGGKRKKEGNK